MFPFFFSPSSSTPETHKHPSLRTIKLNNLKDTRSLLPKSSIHPINMLFPSKTNTLTLLTAAFTMTNGAVLNLFSDQNCQVAAGQRNVYDNTCAELGGFQSYVIVNAGGDGQDVTAYSRNACAGPYNSCVSAKSTGICYPAFSSDGGSNAASSGAACGLFKREEEQEKKKIRGMSWSKEE